MTLGPSHYAELRTKHLEMLQSVIARMAGQGATLKNYCITLVTGVCGFAITLKNSNVVLLAFLPVTIFALLDARYLCLERSFRALFDRVRTEDWGKPPTFELKGNGAPSVSYLHAFLSWSILMFYGSLAIGVLIVLLVTRKAYG